MPEVLRSGRRRPRPPTLPMRRLSDGLCLRYALSFLRSRDVASVSAHPADRHQQDADLAFRNADAAAPARPGGSHVPHQQVGRPTPRSSLPSAPCSAVGQLDQDVAIDFAAAPAGQGGSWPSGPARECDSELLIAVWQAVSEYPREIGRRLQSSGHHPGTLLRTTPRTAGPAASTKISMHNCRTTQEGKSTGTSLLWHARISRSRPK